MFVKLLNYPVVRHLIAGLLIVLLLWIFSIAPLQEQNEDLRKDLKEVRNKQYRLISQLAKKDTYKIQNQVDGAKIKKGGEIKLIPSNALEVINLTDTVAPKVSEDTIKYRKYFWQLWRKRNKKK